jgi:mannose-6-phosphate isomerase-like protein (cupin superfamily)
MEFSIFSQADLPRINHVPTWEGRCLGNAAISVLFVDAPPGLGPQLHQHPYAEIFLVHAGEALFTIGEQTLDVSAGNIVVVEAFVPHKFVSSGAGHLWQTDIHLSPTIQTTWL